MFIKSNSEVHCIISVLELCVCDQNKSLNPFALWQSFSAMIFTLPIQYYLLLFILFFYLFWLFCHFWSFEFRSSFSRKKKEKTTSMLYDAWMKLMQRKTAFFPHGHQSIQPLSALYIHWVQWFALCYSSAFEMHIKWSSTNTKYYWNLCCSRVFNHSP